MLQNAHCIGVACVLITAIEGSMSYRPILTANIGLMNTNFDILHLKLGKVRQWNVGTIEELWQHISIQLFLVFIVCFYIDTLHVVGVRAASSINWWLRNRSLRLMRSLLCFWFCHWL